MENLLTKRGLVSWVRLSLFVVLIKFIIFALEQEQFLDVFTVLKRYSFSFKTVSLSQTYPEIVNLLAFPFFSLLFLSLFEYSRKDSNYDKSDFWGGAGLGAFCSIVLYFLVPGFTVTVLVIIGLIGIFKLGWEFKDFFIFISVSALSAGYIYSVFNGVYFGILWSLFFFLLLLVSWLLLMGLPAFIWNRCGGKKLFDWLTAKDVD